MYIPEKYCKVSKGRMHSEIGGVSWTDKYIAKYETSFILQKMPKNSCFYVKKHGIYL